MLWTCFVEKERFKNSSVRVNALRTLHLFCAHALAKICFANFAESCIFRFSRTKRGIAFAIPLFVGLNE